MRTARSAILRLLALVVAGGALLAAMVVWPVINEITQADAVVLLSGDGARLPGALELMERKIAPTLVFVGEPDTLPVVDLCGHPQPFEVICLRPSPDSTRAEARATGELVRARGWNTMVVVTSRFHATRARLLFRRCSGVTVEAVGEYPGYGRRFAARQVAHEWLSLIHTSLLARGC